MLRKALLRSAEDFEISTYNNPLEALSRLRSSGADVVLLDVMMGHMNGFDALKEIKMLSPGTKVIMMSAYSFDPGETMSGCKGLADDFLWKPFESLKSVEHAVVSVSACEESSGKRFTQRGFPER